MAVHLEISLGRAGAALEGRVDLAPVAANCCQNTIMSCGKSNSQHWSVWKAKTESLERILSELWVPRASEERSYKSLRKRIPGRYPDKPNTPERINFQTTVCPCAGKIILSGKSSPVITLQLLVTSFQWASPAPNSMAEDLRMDFTGVREHVSTAGAQITSSLASGSFPGCQDHTANFWRENSRMLQIAPYWWPILLCSFKFCRFQRSGLFAWAGLLFFPEIYFSLISISLFSI